MLDLGSSGHLLPFDSCGRCGSSVSLARSCLRGPSLRRHVPVLPAGRFDQTSIQIYVGPSSSSSKTRDVPGVVRCPSSMDKFAWTNPDQTEEVFNVSVAEGGHHVTLTPATHAKKA